MRITGLVPPSLLSPLRLVIGVGVLAVASITLAAALWSAAGDRETSFWGIDFGDYWLAGNRVLSGSIPYAPEMLDGPFAADGVDRFRYPPPFALMIAPLSVMPLDTATVVWAVISGASLIAGCVLAARAGGVRLTPTAIIWLLALLVLARPVRDLVRVGNVGGVEVLLYGLAIAAAPLIASAALGALGVLKILPALAWPAAFVRDARAALKGFALVGVVLLVTLPLLWSAWMAFPAVLINQIRGGGADDPGNLALVEVMRNLAPSQPILAALTQISVFGLAAGLFVLSLWWASREGGWVGALLAATAASLLLPGTMWFHYLVLLAPFVAYAWPRLGMPVQALVIVAVVGLRFGPPALLLVEDILVMGFVAIMLWRLRPAASAAPGYVLAGQVSRS